MMEACEILEKALSRERISEEEALILLQEKDLLLLGQVANLILERFHPDNIVTFLIDRNINYTNICISKCKFCAFYRQKDDPQAYLLDKEEILTRIKEAIAVGGTQIMLQGGLHPDLDIHYFTELLSSIKEKYDVCIHSFSPPEIAHIAKVSGLSTVDTLQRLKAAGLNSLPGGGAEILVDEVRAKISPNKIDTFLWLKVMEEAHKMGMSTTATMMLGSVENLEHRIAHLSNLRNLQDKTGGFKAFIPWSYQSGHTELGGRSVSSIDYLKTLAVSRIFLDNFENVQGSWVTQGKEIGQLSLNFGANDLGSIMLEENVLKATGISYKMSKEKMIRIIKSTGKIAAQRGTNYEILATF